MSIRRRSLVLALLGAALVAATARAQVSTPAIEGPIGSPGSAFIQATSFPLSQVGYVSEEFFIKGTATAYANVGPLGKDGLWTVTPAETAEYTTRIVVFRPEKAKKFNGTVIVEWLNVSGGVEAGPDWILSHTELIREGYVWVGVSAQYAGVEGGPGLGIGIISLPLKQVNPVRYGTLNHPTDSYSYDIFSQAAAAVRSPAGPLADYKIKKVIAAGESQSAFRMVTYVNGIHPLTHIFDGYFIHSRGAFGANLREAPLSAIPVPGTAVIRADVDVPVLVLETETDLTFLGYLGARQDDAEHFRLWEVAGTSHADSYISGGGMADLGTSPEIVAINAPSSPVPGILDCGLPINSGPQHFRREGGDRRAEQVGPEGQGAEVGAAPRGEPQPADDRDRRARQRRRRHPDAARVDVSRSSRSRPAVRLEGLLHALRHDHGLPTDAQLAALNPIHKDFDSKYKKHQASQKAGWISRPTRSS
jgi:hypothetical protein